MYNTEGIMMMCFKQSESCSMRTICVLRVEWVLTVDDSSAQKNI